MRILAIVLLVASAFFSAILADELEPSKSGIDSGFFLPEAFSFCDEPVPMDHGDVKERLETQLRLYARNLGQIELWVKRKHRYFPVVEKLVKDQGLPEDIKYLSVVESALQTRVISSKEAVGPWQFIDSTGEKYGLRITDEIDERLDVDISTRAALRYLRDLYDEFTNWPMAMAAYNIGQGRILNEIYEQGTNVYFDMILPLETDRYVCKIMAAKIILENPEKFGLDLDKLGKFSDPESVSKTVVLNHGVPVRILAFCGGMSNREFILANPWIVNPFLKKGTFVFQIKSGAEKQFDELLDQYRILVKDTVDYPKLERYRVDAEDASMRLGPSKDFPEFRKAPKGEIIPIKGRTASKDDGNYWYLFEIEKNKNGWIWGGYIDKAN